MASQLDQTFDLVQEAQSGNAFAMELLFLRYYPRTQKVVELRLGRHLRGRVEVQDVLQETFIAAFRGFENFRMENESSLINWLSKLAEHRIVSMERHESALKREASRLVGITVDELADVIEAEDDGRAIIPLELAIRNEELHRVEDTITELSAPHREVIILRNYLGMSWAQVALEMERPSDDAARMLHAYAVKDLSRRLGDMVDAGA